ncbi:MAG: Fic family protein [Candidatus Omnitrophica bacterium]|nr:Fic family protein [Candidatus Omnitrophota bacterium]
MFKPNYRITEYLLQLIEQIAAISSKIESKKIRFTLMTRLQSEALERNAHSSTSIEGNLLSLAQVSALNHNRDVSAAFKQKKEVLNYFKALRWIIKNPKRKLSRVNLLELHTLITRNLLPNEKSGKFRKKQNFVVDKNKMVVFTPPASKKCSKLISELLAWTNKGIKTHPIILSAIFHHQFVNIHPFSDGNGRVARAAAQWMLYQKNFDPYHILSLDDFYAGDRDKYYSKIQQARELDYDFTSWIEYVAEGILATLKKTYSRIHKLSYSSQEKITITPKQEELLNLLYMHGSLGSKKLCKLLKINRARVNQLISPLVEAKIIKKEGKARATNYYIRK